MNDPRPGDWVAVDGGQWDGRVGVLARYDVVHSGQVRVYPVVDLVAVRRRRARTVRVCTVRPCGPPPPPPPPPTPPGPSRQRRLYDAVTWVHRKFAAGEVIPASWP